MISLCNVMLISLAKTSNWENFPFIVQEGKKFEAFDLMIPVD